MKNHIIEYEFTLKLRITREEIRAASSLAALNVEKLHTLQERLARQFDEMWPGVESLVALEHWRD